MGLSAGQKETTIVCMGDSITWGYPFGPEYSWVKIAADSLGVRMVNRGINGETSADLLRRFHKEVLDRRPTHVFILVGANDASLRNSLASFSASVSQMVSQAEANNVEAMIGVPIPCADPWLEFTLEKYRGWLRGYALEKGLTTVDFGVDMFKEKRANPDYLMDEVHPSKLGYQVMASVFVNAFKPERKG